MSKKEFMKIYRGFPYMMCKDTAQIQRFLGEFKKYRFDKRQVSRVCIRSGGILGSKVSNVFGLFEALKLYGIPAKDGV